MTRRRSPATVADPVYNPTGQQLIQKMRHESQHHASAISQKPPTEITEEEKTHQQGPATNLEREANIKKCSIQIRKHISDTAAATLKYGDINGVEIGELTRTIRTACPNTIEKEELAVTFIQEVLTKAWHRFHSHRSRGQTVFTRA